MIRKINEIPFTDDGALKLLTDILNCDKSDILFVDIETTGLSPKSSDLYLIGAAYFEDNIWKSIQFFAESPEHEREIVTSFADFASRYKKLVHFNGNRFDIPYLESKLDKHGLKSPLKKMESFDLYKSVSPYKTALGLPDCKQKTIEKFLGIDREDQYDGGKLIEVYKSYADNRDRQSERLLLLHNSDDISGMLGVLSMLSYHQFFSLFKNIPETSIRTDEEIKAADYAAALPVKAVKVQANYYEDYDGSPKREVYMKLSLPVKLPSVISGNLDGCFFKAIGNEATLRVPLYEEELKYFYSNYRDYYYLPHEDMAVHKSLATFVDKNFREKAKPENCYTKKAGQYLPEWDLVFAPFFKRDYADKRFFFDLNENMKKSRFAMSLYATHVIGRVLGVK